MVMVTVNDSDDEDRKASINVSDGDINDQTMLLISMIVTSMMVTMVSMAVMMKSTMVMVKVISMMAMVISMMVMTKTWMVLCAAGDKTTVNARWWWQPWLRRYDQSRLAIMVSLMDVVLLQRNLKLSGLTNQGLSFGH